MNKRPHRLLVGAGLAAFVMSGCGGSELEEAQAALTNIESDLSTVEADLAEQRERAEDAEGRVADAEIRADEAEESASEAMREELEELAQQLRDEAAAELDEATAALEQREAELDTQADDLDEREDQIASELARLERVKQAEFGDGTWEVGVDIDPGTYRIVPGDGCYWARLRDRDGARGSILDNNNARGGQEIVTIAASDAYFESKRCGTWTPA